MNVEEISIAHMCDVTPEPSAFVNVHVSLDFISIVNLKEMYQIYKFHTHEASQQGLPLLD